MPTAPTTLFASLFQPAELVQESDLARFEQFLPRRAGEPDNRYAERLEGEGLAFVVTSEDVRDIPQFKATLDAARDAGVPVAFLSAPLPDPIAERMRERAMKSPHDHLREARDAQANGG